MIPGWTAFVAAAVASRARVLQEWISRGGRFRYHCPEGLPFRMRVWAFPTGDVVTIHCPSCGLYEVTDGAEFIP